MTNHTELFIESLINTDETESGDLSQMIRGALADEQSAINLYTKIIKNTESKEIREILEEIANDERNHTGKLLYVLRQIDPEYKHTEAGQNNTEV